MDNKTVTQCSGVKLTNLIFNIDEYVIIDCNSFSVNEGTVILDRPISPPICYLQGNITAIVYPQHGILYDDVYIRIITPTMVTVQLDRSIYNISDMLGAVIVLNEKDNNFKRCITMLDNLDSGYYDNCLKEIFDRYDLRWDDRRHGVKKKLDELSDFTCS